MVRNGGSRGPNPGKSSPGRGLDGISPTLNLGKSGEDTVSLLLVGNVEFDALVRNVYIALVDATDAQGLVLNFTQEDLSRYFVSAMYARVANVTYGRQVVRPEDLWALPSPWAYAINAIGRVDLGNGLTIVPEWAGSPNPSPDGIMSRDETMRMTSRLKALEPLGFRWIRQIEKSRDGDKTVMAIIPTVDQHGDVIFTSHQPATGIHFMTAAVIGIQSVVVPAGIPKAWLPDYTLDARRLVQFRERYAQQSSAVTSDTV